MVELVPPQKHPLEVERRQQMVDPREPLRHAVVVGIFGLHAEFRTECTNLSDDRSLTINQTTVGRKLGQQGIPFMDQLQRWLLTRKQFAGSTVDQRYEIVVEIR